MKRRCNQQKGVTLIALTLTIIILLIIAGIAINSGKDTLEMAKLEELKTNMLLIQAKAREYVEDANFKMGINPNEEKKTAVRQEVYVDKAGLSLVDSSDAVISKCNISDVATKPCYKLTSTTLNKWGLSKVKLEENEEYLVQFDEQNATVEVYNTIGYEGKYSLTDIDKIQK